MSGPAIREPSGQLLRAPNGTFPKGVSGNVSGRPKGDVQALARTHTEAALHALVAALQNPRERVQAAVAILDRGWGKPAQMIQAADDAASFTFAHLVAAREVLIQINAERSIEGRVVAADSNGGAASPGNGVTPRAPIDLMQPAEE